MSVTNTNRKAGKKKLEAQHKGRKRLWTHTYTPPMCVCATMAILVCIYDRTYSHGTQRSLLFHCFWWWCCHCCVYMAMGLLGYMAIVAAGRSGAEGRSLRQRQHLGLINFRFAYLFLRRRVQLAVRGPSAAEPSSRRGPQTHTQTPSHKENLWGIPPPKALQCPTILEAGIFHIHHGCTFSFTCVHCTFIVHF